MIAAVIFDCDGVLVDSEVLALEAEHATLASFGIEVDRGGYAARFLGLNDAAWLAALTETYPAITPHIDDFYRRAKSVYLASLETDRLQPIAGIADVVAALGLPKAVASSSPAGPLRRKLERTALWPLFAPHVYSADLVARGKPWPDVFVHAAAALNIAPDACLAIEDSENGVRAALAAGMKVWGFTGGAHCDPGHDARLSAAGAERVLGGWAEARELFAAM